MQRCASRDVSKLHITTMLNKKLQHIQVAIGSCLVYCCGTSLIKLFCTLKYNQEYAISEALLAELTLGGMTPWHLHNDIYKYPHQSTKFLHQKLPSALIPLGQQLNHNYSKLVNNVHLICTAHDGVQDTFLSRGIGKKHRLNNNKKNEYHF